MTRARGFTLIEVLVALAVASVVALLVHRLFSGMIDGVQRAAEARTALDREINARRWLKSAFLSLEVGTPESGGFEGRQTRLSFGTWQLVPGGWFEPRRITLKRVGAWLTAGDLVLADSVRDVEFDYLLELGANAVWVREWISPVSAPVAVRIRLTWDAGYGIRDTGVDTTLLLIKERG